MTVITGLLYVHIVSVPIVKIIYIFSKIILYKKNGIKRIRVMIRIRKISY